MAPVNSRMLAAQLAASSAAIYLHCANNKIGRKKRKWVREWIKRRNDRGAYAMLSNELRLEDPDNFKNYLRMSNADFEKLLSIVGPAITKNDTVMRPAISAAEKLGITLRFLATGESYKSLQFSSRISQSFMSINIPLVCQAIYESLKEEYIKFPTNSQDWEKIAERFNARWQFPLCLGAMDGKHITFRAARKDGSYFRNYKNSNSIVLLALVDADYRFIFIDVGCNGRVSDGGVLKASVLDDVLLHSDHFPANAVLGNDRHLPFVMLADDAFPLTTRIMKPFSYKTKCKKEEAFNYRLSRARMCVEKAFGILANRYRVLLNPMHVTVDKVETITLAACTLHNFLAKTSEPYKKSLKEKVPDCPWDSLRANNARFKNSAAQVRAEFAEYFSSEGDIDWSCS